MIRLMIVHEDKLICDSTARLLCHEPDIELVACATSETVALARYQPCDVALVSVGLAGQEGQTLVRELLRRDPALKVLAVALVEDCEAILRFVEAGAVGYLLATDSTEVMIRRIRAAHVHEAIISPQIAATIMRRLADLADGRPVTAVLPEALTPRENQVLKLMSQGLSNREIAEELVIELGTAKNHVHSILTKLGAETRQKAVAMHTGTRPRQLTEGQ